VVRGIEPGIGKLVIPGGHVDLSDESVSAAAARELEEEAGIRVNPEDLQFVTILDAPDRDPRPDRRITVTYTYNVGRIEDLGHYRAGDDAQEVVIRSLDTLMEDEIGFDHWLVIAHLKKRYAKK